MATRSIIKSFDVSKDITSCFLTCCIMLVMDEFGFERVEEAHQGTSSEYPPHVRCDRKQQCAGQGSKEAGHHRRAATNLIGNSAEADQHDNDENRIDSEDCRRHRMGEMPFLGIKPVCQCRRRTCPKRMTDHARRNQQARMAPEDERPSHRRLLPVRHVTANGRRRHLDHHCRPFELCKVSGIRTSIGEVCQVNRFRTQPCDAPARCVAISRLGDGPDYEAVLPPLTLMTWPVMNDALREATNTMASAISAGVPTRLRGTPATSPAFRSAIPVKRFSISVSTGPGATALTSTTAPAPSSAAAFVRPSTACLLATYIDAPAAPRLPKVDDRLTMLPCPWASITRISCFRLRIVPSTLVSKVAA